MNNLIKTTLLIMVAALLAACASTPPAELVDARQAYERAQTSDAQAFAPADLKDAADKLERAEALFEDEGDEEETRDQAYIAHRAAEVAIVKANTYRANQLREKYEQALLSENEAVRRAAVSSLRDERQRRQQAERAAQEAMARLNQIANVQQDERGTVISIAGSLLFRFDESELTTPARDKLHDVARALLATREGSVVVEGHTDSQGTDMYNRELSEARAQAVRTFLINQGIAPDRISAVGKGESNPIASNDTPEGRANNRRVEIIVADADR